MSKFLEISPLVSHSSHYAILPFEGDGHLCHLKLGAVYTAVWVILRNLQTIKRNF